MVVYPYILLLNLIEYLYSAFPSGALIQDKGGLVPLQYAQQLYQPDIYGEEIENQQGHGGTQGQGQGQGQGQSPKSRGRTRVGTQLTVYNNESDPNDSTTNPYPAVDTRSSYGSGVNTRHGGAGGYGGEDSDNYAIITGEEPSLAQFRPILDSERDRKEKYIRIQKLLLGSHPTIARLGGASSFSRFGVNRK